MLILSLEQMHMDTLTRELPCLLAWSNSVPIHDWKDGMDVQDIIIPIRWYLVSAIPTSVAQAFLTIAIFF